MKTKYLKATLKYRHALTLAGIGLGLISSPTHAHAWWWKAPDHGFAIEIDTPEGIAQKSGAQAKLQGQIAWVHAHSNGKLPVPAGIASQIEVRAYFPDLTQEVTDQITLDNQKFTFSYLTPSLKADDLNVLTVTVGRTSPAERALQKLQAKLERRALLLSRLKGKLGGKEAPEEELSKIHALQATLEKISQKISEKLASQMTVLAERRFPLQVDNLVSPAALHSSLVGGFKFDLSYAIGSAIEGQKTSVTSKITNFRGNLKDVSFEEKAQAGSQWTIDYSWKGALLQKSSPQSIPVGAVVEYQFETGKLLPLDQNTFQAVLSKAGNGSSIKRFGSLSLNEPVAADSTPPKWIAPVTPDAAHPYVKAAQPLSARIGDEFGLVDAATLKASLSADLFTGESLSRDLTSKISITKIGEGQAFDLKGDLNPLAEGVYRLTLSGSDLAGNAADPNPYQVSFQVDRTKPAVTLGAQDHVLTNQPLFHLPVTVTDYSPVTTKVLHNGLQIHATSDASFTLAITLKEGLNLFEIQSIDAAGNASDALKLNDIVLDTIPPVLSGLIPSSGAILSTLSFFVSGTSNEPLARARVNGAELTLAESRKGFSGTHTAHTEGSLELTLEAADLAGNTSSETIAVSVILKILNSDLLSVAPDPAGTHLWIQGAPGATRPGLTVKATASFFNSASTVANLDGSFSIKLYAFKEAALSVYDPETHRTEKASVYWGAEGTTLSGIVKDTSGNPLPGASISLSGFEQTVVTDASGVFSFVNPPTGDQKLVIDGSTITQDPELTQRKFSATQLAITVGLNEKNVLDRPIFLAPLLLDGTQTQVDENTTTVVTSPHAPGVVLSVPPKSAVFRDGSSIGEISVATIPAEFATTEPLEFAQPSEVVALEPSGLKFSEPVELTLPNTNDLPPGEDVVILSMNSSKGIWEIGGAAKVSEDGTSIVTKPGMGIAHFSLVYATPLGPIVKRTGDQDAPGADTFNGAVSTSINLPSYRLFGESVTPSLVYKSSWAKPTTVVTSLFDVPAREIKVDPIKAGNVEITFTGESKIYPDLITAQFETTGSKTEPFSLRGSPNKANISFAVDLKDQETGEYLPTDSYPYFAHYEVKYKQLIVGTIKKKERVFRLFMGPQTRVSQESYRETRDLEKLFPSDLSGYIYAQNQVDSSAGRGWRVAGPQRITNPHSNRVLLEEADGSLASYTVNNTIETVLNGAQFGLNLSAGVDLSNWPKVAVGYGKSIDQVDLSSSFPQKEPIGVVGNYEGAMVTQEFVSSTNGLFGMKSICGYYRYYFNWTPSTQALLMTPEGEVYGSNTRMHTLFKVSSGSSSFIGGRKLAAPTYVQRRYWFEPETSWRFNHGPLLTHCKNSSGLSCTFHSKWANDYNGWNNCPTVKSSGFVPGPGFNGDGTATSVALNSPLGITSGIRPNTIVFADTGNHRVRELDISTGVVTTIAGNGSKSDYGDGGSALEAGIYHPRGVVYDAAGNLYISTERGFVRRVSPGGQISSLVGGPDAELADNRHASEVILKKPYGMVIDNENGYLYVAETDGHAVRRVDLTTHEIITIAGTRTAGQSLNGVPATAAALNAPTFLGLDHERNLIIVDSGNNKIRRVNLQNQSVGTLAFVPLSHDNSELIRHPNLTWERRHRNGAIDYFDARGLHLETRNLVGNRMQYFYDASDRLIETVDAVGRSTVYRYSGGQLNSITDPAGRTTEFIFSGNFLSRVIFPDGSFKDYSYDPEGLLLTETNERGFRTEYHYNAWNRLEKVIRPDQKVLGVNDSGSATVANAYTNGAVGDLKRSGTAAGQSYDSLVDAKNIETKFAKDENGFITLVEDGLGRVTQIERNARGQQTRITRPDGTVLSFVYDGSTGELLSQTDSATGITTKQQYDAYGHLIYQLDARGYSTAATYNSLGLLQSKTDQSGRSVAYAYTPMGQVRETTDPILGTVRNTYDARGNLASIQSPDGSIRSFTYDSAGNITAQVEGAEPNTRITQFEYDAFNRLTAVISPKGERTEYAYLPTGELELIRDPYGNVRTNSYDELGRLVTITSTHGYETHFSYDANGNLEQKIDPAGNLSRYEYDNDNRMVAKYLSDDTVRFGYDTNGNLILAQNSVSTVDQAYNEFGALVASTVSGRGTLSGYPEVEISYDYDVNGNRTQMSESAGQGLYRYTYDGLNRVTSITNHKGEYFDYQYSQTSPSVSIYRPGSFTTTSLDIVNRKLAHDHYSRSSNSPILSFLEYRDVFGNRQQVTGTSGTKTYAYDKNNQLTSAKHVTAEQTTEESYEYDAISNRVADHAGTYQYDEKRKLLAEDYRYFYHYDKNGNLIVRQEKANFPSGEITNYSYTSENQLTYVKISSSGQTLKEAFYSYDAMGRRIQRQVVDHRASTDPAKTFTRKYVYDERDILLEYDASNRLLAQYSHAPQVDDDVLSVEITPAGVDAKLAQASGSYFYLKDSLGNVVQIVDTDGYRLQEYVYSAFGEIREIRDSLGQEISSRPVLATSYTFTGREHDPETGLYYYRARYYDPKVGRFLQEDPHPGQLSLPASVTNAYAYVLNNPINFTDPTGEFIGKAWKGIKKIGKAVWGGMSAVVKSDIFRIAAVITAAAFTGGAAAALLVPAGIGGVAGAALGFGIGAIAGGVTGGFVNLALGGSFKEGFLMGAVAGGVAGALAGYSVGSSVGSSSGPNPAKSIELAKNAVCAAISPITLIGAAAAAAMIYYGFKILWESSILKTLEEGGSGGRTGGACSGGQSGVMIARSTYEGGEVQELFDSLPKITLRTV